MKNFFKVFGVIALTAVIGFSTVACDNGTGGGDDGNKTDPALNGTWVGVGNNMGMNFNNGSLEMTVDGAKAYQGTYATNNNNITITVTGIHGDFSLYKPYGLGSRWYSKSEFKSLTGVTDTRLNEIFSISTLPYSVTGNILSLYNDNGSVSTFTKDTGSNAGNYSIDGVWESNSGGRRITVSGSTGVLSVIGTFDEPVFVDAVNKGYLSIGSTVWRNLTKTGNSTWTGQVITVQFYTSSPNVAIGTSWGSTTTFTMSADGQTLTQGSTNSIWTRVSGGSSGGGASGGSKANPYTLDQDNWRNHEVSGSGEVWYTFNILNETSYYIWWNDRNDGDGTKTADIFIEAYYGNDESYIFSADSGWSAYQQIITYTGPKVLKIKVRHNTGGTYALTYSTTDQRPY